MSGSNISDVTAVVANWLTAASTLHAIESFRKFYPELPLIVVDDDSDQRDRSEFFIDYNSNNNSPERMYDPDTDKLMHLDHTVFLQVEPHHHYGKGEGKAIDLAMLHTPTKWMFHFHSDYRFSQGGIIEELLSYADEKTCAVGEDKKKHKDLPALSGVVELINVELGMEHCLSYQPIVYRDDGTFNPLLEGGEGYPIAAGGYYTGRLAQLGYEVKLINGLASKYGRHLRWEGDEELWNRYF